jgi:hypothetical protein
MTPDDLERQTARGLDALRYELGDRVTAEEVAAVGRRQFERLIRDATITDFIPLLVYRCAKDELLRRVPAELDHAA